VNAIPLDISRDRAVLDSIYQNPQPYRPWTHFGGVNLWSNFAHSTYHSGTAKVEKRFSRGLNMTSFYTWGKAMGEADNDGGASGVTYYNRRLEKARTGFDVKHRAVTYLTYELPFGRGRRWMTKGGWSDSVLGGWNISLVQVFQTGTPATFTVAGSPYRYLPGTVRPLQRVPDDQVTFPDYTIGDRFNNTLKNPFWDIGAFAYPQAYDVGGTIGRNTVDGHGINWTQTSLAKNFTFRERYKLDVRFDIQNPFKRTAFVNPSSAVNLVNPGLFGKPVTNSPTGWCCIGGQFVGILGLKLSF
jgi:hypothetical protein